MSRQNAFGGNDCADRPRGREGGYPQPAKLLGSISLQWRVLRKTYQRISPAINRLSMHSPGLSVVVGIHGRIHVVKFVAVENPVGCTNVRRAVEENVHRQRHDHDGNQPKQRARESRGGNQAEHAPEVKPRWIYKLAEKKRNGMVTTRQVVVKNEAHTTYALLIDSSASQAVSLYSNNVQEGFSQTRIFGVAQENSISIIAQSGET